MDTPPPIPPQSPQPMPRPPQAAGQPVQQTPLPPLPQGQPLPPPPGQFGAGLNLPPEDIVNPPLAAPLSFWQQPWVQNVLPFVTSLALHAAVIIFGLAFFGVVQQATRPPLQEQLVVPEAVVSEGVPGGVENPGIGGDPTRAAAQDQFTENTMPDGWAPKPGESAIAEAMGGGAGDATDAMIGLGPGGGFGQGLGIGSGKGDARGSGTGDGRGRLAPFGTPGGGIPGPKGKLFGKGGNALSIAFVCDSSGSMIDKLSSLKSELNKAVQELKPIQTFSVVFFRDEKALAFENGALIPATPGNKRKLYTWLEDIGTTGTSDPIPGLEVAFKPKPQLVYILTDGDFPNNEEVTAKVAQLNKDKRSRVNTVAFVTSKDDPTSESFLKFLETLAAANGGQFKHVALDELD